YRQFSASVGDPRTGSNSGESLAPHSQSLDQIDPRLEADSWRGRNSNRAVARDGDLGLDDVPSPVTLAGRNVARQREVWPRGERDVMRPADARLQHSAAPHGHAALLAQVMYASRLRVPSNPAK